MKLKVKHFLLSLMVVTLLGICTAPSTLAQTSVDIEIELAVDATEPALGSIVILTATAHNKSTNDATGIEVIELLDAGLSAISSLPSTGSYDKNTGLWTVGDLSQGASETLVIQAQVLTLNRICQAVTLTALDQEDSNGKNNKFTLCLYPKESEELDLAITKSVYNAVPQVGGESVFTITVTNLSSVLMATNVQIEDILDPNLVYKYSTESIGTYDSGSGIWTIAMLLPGQTATMDMAVTANGSADNIAKLKSLDQTDTNPDNNEDIASVNVSGSSGGNEGGLESEGSLADKIAVRNFSRSKEVQKMDFEQPQQMNAYTRNLAKMGVITPASQLKSMSNLAELFPEYGPYESQAFVSTPEDLLGITNANEVFAVDYFNQAAQRMGAILALTTQNGEVYNHTKMVCDRMTGSTLDFARTIKVAGNEYILGKLVQPDGMVDYTVSFIVWEDETGLLIDNQWNNENYNPSDQGLIYNFQVWAVTPEATTQLLESVLAELASTQTIQMVRASAPIPEVYALNGYYEQGKLVLNLNTDGTAQEIIVQGNLSRYEGSIRENFSYPIQVPESQEKTVRLEIPTGHLFDAGFSLIHEGAAVHDVLYFADGPWGKYVEEDGAWISELSMEEHLGGSYTDSYLFERNAYMQGQVRSYASLFRAVKAGGQSLDLSAYGILEFDASGSGQVELIIAKQSIDNWNEEYRTSFYLSPDEKSYQIDLSRLIGGLKGGGFTGEDVESIVFNVLGDGENWTDFSIAVKNLRFSKGSSDLDLTENMTISLNSYPNPMRDVSTIEFELPERGSVDLMVFDITGKLVQEITHEEYPAGSHQIQFLAGDLSNGIYFMKLRYNHQVETNRFNILR